MGRPVTHIVTLAGGVLLGALLMVMFLHDGTLRAVGDLTAGLNERVVCLPTVRIK